MGLNMKVNGTLKKIIVMVEAIKFGLTEASMKDTGNLTKLMAEEDSSMLMGISMMVTGKMIKHMDSDNILTLTVLSMKVIG